MYEWSELGLANQAPTFCVSRSFQMLPSGQGIPARPISMDFGCFNMDKAEAPSLSCDNVDGQEIVYSSGKDRFQGVGGESVRLEAPGGIACSEIEPAGQRTRILRGGLESG